MGIDFQYEPEGFVIPGVGPYLPDFYLPHIRFFAEVKPDELIPAEMWKLEELARSTGRQALMLVGPPDYKPYLGFFHDCDFFTYCPYSLDIHATRAFSEGRLFSCPSEISQRTCSLRYRQAVEKSRGDRFEK